MITGDNIFVAVHAAFTA